MSVLLCADERRALRVSIFFCIRHNGNRRPQSRMTGFVCRASGASIVPTVSFPEILYVPAHEEQRETF
jgi:hypothetical protein